ncbi:MAG: single-stranded-DNA-specific exonuclease RecJ [Rhodospirillales bacterium]
MEADSTLAAEVLGVERSILGRRWRLREAEDRTARTLSQRFDLPDILGRVLAGRGVGPETAHAFLNPSLRESMPDPSSLLDMDPAAERIAAAVMQGETVAVFGDYDVDGATSTAQILRYLNAAGGKGIFHIPDRVREGYGPNAPALLRLGEQGASVIVTVDCGTAAHEPLAEAQGAGLDVIVVDHHAAEARLPPALAVVNPNRMDENSPLGHLAAAGLVFLLLAAVNRALRGAGWFKTRPEPDLLELLDLVALGTVCDVVPLKGLNRAFVHQGLKVMAKRRNTGLAALADVAGMDEAPRAYHLGFVLGPRVNAGGRVGGADLGTRLLAGADAGEARGLAEQLNGFNRERQDIEANVLDAAMAAVESGGVGDAALIFAAGEGWHPGVIGIVAGRLRERYDRPACVIALNGEGGSASARSVPGVDIGAAVIAARQAGLLTRGGGHPMAAGFSVEREKLEAAREFMNARIAEHVNAADVIPTLTLDGALSAGGANLELAQALESIGPFGSGNPEPRFALPAMRIAYADPVGTSHLRLSLGDGGRGGGLKSIAFRAFDGPLGEALLNHGGRLFHIAGRLKVDTFRGETKASFQVEDAAPA